MKVRDAITQLSALPQDLEIMDDYCENVVDNFSVSSCGENGTEHQYVACEMSEVDD